MLEKLKDGAEFTGHVRDGITFVKFGAEWCGPCKALGPTIDELASEFSGKVKIVRTDDDGREVILSILGESDFFGEMSMLDGLARSASAVATSKAELFMIHRQDFLKLLHDYPPVTVALLQELTMRLRKADSQIKSLSLKDATGRVANVVLQLADDIGIIRKGRVEIDDMPLQQDLANMAGTSRETISRTMHTFIKKGHLEMLGNKLIIKDYEKFKSLYL